jgi:hypothetical protein
VSESESQTSASPNEASRPAAKLGDPFLPPSQRDGKVVRGKDGWLFLDSDTNFVMRQHTGELLFSQEQLDHWQRLLENRIAWLEKRGIPFFFLVAPNPHAIYPDKLPDGVTVAETRPVIQLIDHLAERRSYAGLIYPLDELRVRRDENVYAQTNTHWTELGAFVAYRKLTEEIAKVAPVRRLEDDDIRFHAHPFEGDLGSKVDPQQKSLHVWAELRDTRARFVADNRVYRTGRRIDYECDAAPNVKCLVMGDSFAYQGLIYLAESFGRVISAYISTLDYALVEREQPDVVVQVMNERFMIRVPVDVPAKSLDEHATEKRARGEMFAPRTIEGNRVDSVLPAAVVETPGSGQRGDPQA